MKRSFVESFRRAVDSLGASGKIQKYNKKIDSIHEFIAKFEFFTSRLELFVLRKSLRTYIEDFIRQEKYRVHTSLDFEEYQVGTLKEKNREKFLEIKSEWKKIENKIYSHLNKYSINVDLLLDIACRGRYLFSKRKKDRGIPLHGLNNQIKTLKEKSELLSDIELDLGRFTIKLSRMEDYRIGEIKNILYQFVKIGTRYSSSTSMDIKLKDFLLKEIPTVIKNLPDHKDSDKSKGPFFSKETQYSPLLDQVFDKYIFRAQIYLIKN